MTSRMANKRKRSLDLNTATGSEDLFHSPVKSQRLQQKTPKKGGDDTLVDDSLFGELISKAGYVLKKGDQPNLLKCDLAIFKKKLQWNLKSHRLYKLPEIAVKFVKDLENHLQDPLKLKWALLYTQTEAGCESARGRQQDSLIRLCLNIEELQPPLIKLLTEKFFEVAYDDENQIAVDIPCLILANLKWLDHIVDSEVLTSNIIELLEGSPIKVQREIITFVPHIVDDANHSKISKVLCDLYDQKPELTPAILDTLGDLTLESESLEEVRHSVLKTLQAVRAEQLPIVTKFLLQSTPQSIAYQVVSDMREKITLPGDYIGGTQRSPSAKKASKKEEDAAAYEVLLISKIKMAILSHKYLANAWLKAIQEADDVADVRHLDFILLVVFYDAVPSRHKPIESIFRNKVRTGLFSDAMIEKTFSNHSTVLKEYFPSVIKVASLLLRSNEPLINQAASAIYRSSFIFLDGHQKQEVILSLLGHFTDHSMAVLSTLSSLAHSHTSEMSKYAIFLKGTLDVVDLLNMGEIKRLLDIVSHLAYSDASHAVLQDELAILVRKQLSHEEIKYKLIGVINAVFSLKNIANVEDSQNSNRSDSRTSDSDLDASSLKEAENLLLLVLSSTAKSSTATALFMDEMASIILKEGLNPKLEEWVCGKMTDDFQDIFILDLQHDTQPEDEFLPLEARWNLEANDDNDNPIVLNLGAMVIKFEMGRSDPFDVESPLVYMASQFRLLRMLESRLREGELVNINALIGCPVYAPREDVYAKFESLSQKEQHVALSCLFYVANWFRELINAFVTQKEKDIKGKVYSRLRQLIEVEKLIWHKLPKCPSYMPPLAVFDIDTSMLSPSLTLTAKKKSKKGRKPTAGKGRKGKKKGKDNTEATQMGTQGASQSVTQLKTQASQPTQDEEAEPPHKEEDLVVDISSCRPFLRELHIDAFTLLFRKLGLETDDENAGLLSTAELEFLLRDLNQKLSHIFADNSKRASVLGHGEQKNIGYSHLDIFLPTEIAQRVYTYFRPVCHHLEAISGFFQNMIADNDGIMDAPGMYSDRVQPMISVSTLLFKTLAIFFSWPALQKEENKEVLHNGLMTLAKRLEGDAVKSMEQEELTSITFRYLSNFHNSVVNIDTAGILIQCLVALTNFPCTENLNEKLVQIVEELLKREWYTKGAQREKGSLYNQHIQSLLEIYLKRSSSTLAFVDTLCTVAMSEFLEDNGRDPHSETFPTLNKGTLGVYYRSMMSFLVTGTKKSLTSLGSASLADKEKYMETWSTAIKIFHVLVTMLKTHDARSLLIPCLKYSHSFLELFLRSAMPVLDSCLRLHNHEVTVLLKNLQGSTRLLQHVCTHSKVNRDTSLIRYVPLVKKSLEMLVYRVKAMLVVNKCSEAFWMGNLKNRDLKGEEILSQSMREEEAEQEEDDNDGQSDVDLEEEHNSKDGEESGVDMEDDDDTKTDNKTGDSNYSVSF